MPALGPTPAVIGSCRADEAILTLLTAQPVVAVKSVQHIPAGAAVFTRTTPSHGEIVAISRAAKS